MRYLSENQFEIYEQVGKGGFGVVYRGLDKVTKKHVAIKHIDLESTDNFDALQKEIRILKHCKLKQITQYYGCFIKGYKLWIIMELLDGGSCCDLMVPGLIKEKYIAILLREVLIALDYLHEHGKIHRDVKAANILLNKEGEVKIADFGVSTELSNNLSRRNTFVGSPYWMSPEVILEEEYNFKADIWSLGITAIEIATGKPPLSELHPMKALFEIPELDPPRLEGSEFSKDFQEFVSLCLQKSPQNRPSASKLLKTRFIRYAGKTSSLVDLVRRKQIYDLQKEKSNPKKKSYYTPTVYKSKEKEGDDIQFDFETEKKPVSNVIITKQSPLGYQSSSVLKKHLALRSNLNIVNTLSSVDLSGQKSGDQHSRNNSTLRANHNANQGIDPKFTGLELVTIIKSSIEELSNGKTNTQTKKIAQLAEAIQQFGSDDSTLLVDLYGILRKNINDSKLLKEQINASHSKVQLPRKSESEKLLLKRWADQYFI